MLLALLVLFQDSPVERYLSEKDAAARAKILSEIKGGVAEVEAELRKPPKRGPADGTGQVIRKKIKANHEKGGEFEYALWVPKDYLPDKAWRLIISLHGQNGNGPDFMRNWLADVQKAGDTFLLCPSAGRGAWGHSLLGYRYVLDSMRDVLANYSVDPDRVFIDGASMGGNGSFQFACTYADLFAGAAPRSGGPVFRYVTVDKKEKVLVAEGLENLLATPIYWTVGAKDPEVSNAWVHIAKEKIDTLKLDCVFQEYPNGGHEWFPQENGKVLEWMGTKRRTAYPPRVGIETNERIFCRAFWLEVVDFKGKEIIKRGYMDTDKKPIEERLIFQEEIRARGDLSTETNEIKITAAGAKEIKVYLHERMVDFTKPVAITVNGSRSTYTAKPSLETLLESARRDRGLLYTAAVKVRVP
jgi:hypothetical protein